ncbi:MAG: hypothetical protein ACO29X_02285 [Arcobacteraceae bacterium]|jgi:hypothetical protein
MLNNEPSMDKIDDYNGTESKEKRSTVNKIIIFCLLVGALLAGLKIAFNNPGDYVGTPQNPGINTAR